MTDSAALVCRSEIANSSENLGTRRKIRHGVWRGCLISSRFVLCGCQLMIIFRLTKPGSRIRTRLHLAFS
ncbi:hypothetical protein FA10DRAFT_167245 [Acaromyces ingoldii]|uniref:Uncharacterized protein n=1 Tax=Acaromyces ingoldii TaxID=215250 RepID=A0A316YKL7_9BASI|nr:hypothetical protein FA10DRAFT_167245 [Acaromyces ingoldii]PWN88593.1 hypothetical protein FA10DRAFT_167245 [Acaromyces ingoldii]